MELLKQSQQTSTIKTGIFYDNTIKSLENQSDCPENLKRISSILSHLEAQELIQKCQIFSSAPHPASLENLLLAHSLEYIKNLEKEAELPQEKILLTKKISNSAVDQEDNVLDFQAGKEVTLIKNNESSNQMDNIYNAKVSVATILQAVDELLSAKTLNNAFAMVRPPGHHAGEKVHCRGTCYFNNVAIAAKYAQKSFGIKKVLIVDWDIHHGDGTQYIFKDDPSVLYFSMHQYDKGTFFPHTGHPENIGSREGKGYSLNIGWNFKIQQSRSITVGDKEYLYAFERLGMPIFKEFDPELILISAGFDACTQSNSQGEEEEGRCHLSMEGYSQMIQKLMTLKKAKIIAALEGGSDLTALRQGTEAVIREFIGLKREGSQEKAKEKGVPNIIAIKAVEASLAVFQQYWPCLLSEELKQYDESVHNQFEISENISAGHRFQYMIRDGQFLKNAKEGEFNFYENINNEAHEHYQENLAFRKFIPEYFGFEEINNVKYLKLQNLLQERPMGSIIDIKLGRNTCDPTANKEKRAKYDKKYMSSTSTQVGFRVSGYIIKDKQGISIEKSRNYKAITLDIIPELLAKLLKSNEEQQINRRAQSEFLKFLEEVLEFFEKHNTRYFIGASVLAIIDNINNSFTFKLVDFNYTGKLPEGQTQDENFLEGLHSLIEFIKKL